MREVSDYKELLRILNKHKVKYLVIGAYAVIYYWVFRGWNLAGHGIAG